MGHYHDIESLSQCTSLKKSWANRDSLRGNVYAQLTRDDPLENISKLGKIEDQGGQAAAHALTVLSSFAPRNVDMGKARSLCWGSSTTFHALI